MTAFRKTECYYNRNNYSAFRIIIMDFSRYIVNFYKNIKLKGYCEPFQSNACGFVCLLRFLCSFLCSLKHTIRTKPIQHKQVYLWPRPRGKLKYQSNFRSTGPLRILICPTQWSTRCHLIHLRRSKKTQHVHGWKQAYPKLMHVLWYPKQITKYEVT